MIYFISNVFNIQIILKKGEILKSFYTIMVELTVVIYTHKL